MQGHVDLINDSDRELIRKLADGDMSAYDQCRSLYLNMPRKSDDHQSAEIRFISECFSERPDKQVMTALRRKILGATTVASANDMGGQLNIEHAQEIAELKHQIENTPQSPARLLAIRRAIVTLLLDHLHSIQATPGLWAKASIANAIAALGMNIHSLEPPTVAWLQVCIADLEKAFEYDQPGVSYTLRERHLDAVTIEELLTTLQSLKECA